MTTRSARFSRKTFALAVALGTAATVAGASWSAQGNGAAKATAGRLEAVTASPATPSSQLFPGGTADTALTLNNPNPVAMTVSSISGNGPITSDAPECNSDSVSFLSQSGAWEVARNASLTVSLPDSVAMALTANDACQGATFTIPVSVTASVTGQGGSANPTTTTAAPTTTTTAAPATLAWTPSSFNYGNVEMGTSSAPQTFLLRNISGPSAQIATGNMPNFQDWQLEFNSCQGATLAEGQSCAVQVRFRPSTSSGPRSALLEARVQGTTGPWTTASLSGVATTAAQVVPQQNSLNFPSSPVGTETAPLTVTFTNYGGSEARNVAASLAGTDAGSFIIKENNCPATLAPGASCTITVSFRPTHDGNNNAQLQLTYITGAGGRGVITSLSGFGS